MPRIPVTQQQQLPSVPSPTGAGQVINTQPGAGQGFQEVGQQIGELATRMREQALAEKKVKLETEAREKLAKKREENLNSPNFRNAPENFEIEAGSIVNETVEQAPFAIQGELQTRLAEKVAIDKAKLRRDAVQKSQEKQLQATENATKQLVKDFAEAESLAERRVIQDNAENKLEDLQESNVLLEEEVESKKNGFKLSAQMSRAQKLIREKRPTEATAYIKSSDLGEEDKRQLLSLAENAQSQNSREYSKYLNDIEKHIRQTSRVPDSVAGVPISKIRQNLQGTAGGEELKFLEETAKDAQQLVKMPLAQQRERLNNMNVEDSTRARRRREVLAGVTAEAEKAAKNRPYQYAEENNLLGTKVRDLPLQDVITGQADPDEINNILSERVVQAQQLSQYYGTRVSPLRPQEVDAVQTVLNQNVGQDADTGTRILKSISDGLGFAQTQRVAEQIAQDDPQIGVATLLAPDAPEVSREILAGRGLEEGDRIEMPSDRTAIAQEEFGQALQGSPRSLNAFMSAADAIYRSRAIKQGKMGAGDPELYRTSLRLAAHGRKSQNGDAVGGPVTVNNTTTLPPVPGTDEQTTKDLFAALRNPNLSRDLLANHANGQPGRQGPDGTIVPMTLSDVGDAQPVYVGAGRYMMKMDDGGFVHSLDGNGEPTGRPLIFDGRGALSSDTFQGANIMSRERERRILEGQSPVQQFEPPEGQ